MTAEVMPVQEDLPARAGRAAHGNRAKKGTELDNASSSTGEAAGAPATTGPETAPLIAWFDDGSQFSSDLLGGKCFGLVQMTAAGLAVPPGFAVTTAAHKSCLEPALLRCLESPHPAQQPQGERADGQLPDGDMAVLHDLAESAPITDAVEHAVLSAYAELARRTGRPDPPVAVRSSGQSEDGTQASFAGQYDTFLWVTGSDAVLDAVRRVWTGSLASNILSYRMQRHLGFGFSPMCIGVQLMINSRSAGVMFTLDPRTGDRSRIVIESSWGLGEAVVGGAVKPDRISVNKVTHAITVEEVGTKEVEYRFSPAAGGVARFPVEPSRRKLTSLSEEEVLELAGLGRQIERLQGAAQDVEWAIDSEGNLSLLQVRPETVWSAQQAASTAPPRPRGALECVVALFSGAG
jgi:pyruvate,water dikinase